MTELSKRREKEGMCYGYVHRTFAGYVKGNLRGKAGEKEGYAGDEWILGS